MADVLKARVWFMVKVQENTPFSFRTDVLTLTRDPQWVYDQALGAMIRALLAVKQPAHHAQVLRHTIEWVPRVRSDSDG